MVHLFDIWPTVSHKFVDEALQEVRASNKVRAMFRAIYQSAVAFTTIKGPDGKEVKSSSFPIRRGVVQGDVTSPLFFILALELLLRRHDAESDKGVTLVVTLNHTLGYVDDIALLEPGDTAGLERLSRRVSAIAKGSRDDADMLILLNTTKALHVCVHQDHQVTTTEAESMSAHTCPHLNCDRKFFNKRGLRIHAARYKWRSEFELECILAHQDDTTNR